jgi:hypothetical protein
MKKSLFTLITLTALMSGSMFASAEIPAEGRPVDPVIIEEERDDQSWQELVENVKGVPNLIRSGYRATKNFVVTHAPESIRPHLTKKNVALAVTTLILARKCNMHKLFYLGTKFSAVGTIKAAYSLLFGKPWFNF